MYFYDSTFFCFIIPALILGFVVQLIVKGQFNKYAQVRTMRGMTGAQVAREILDSNGLDNVTIEETHGFFKRPLRPTHAHSAPVVRGGPRAFGGGGRCSRA